MKKLMKYTMLLLPVFVLFACEDEVEVYKESTNRLNFVYEAYTKSDTLIPRTFVYDPETKGFDTVWLEVTTMGYIVDQERKFVLEQVSTGENQAEADVHYIAFDKSLVEGLYVIPAGKNEARVPVVLKRDPSLKDKEVTLRIKIGSNENFEPGYSTLQEKVITIADILTQPRYWNFYASYYFAGKYGKVKHQFMIDATADMGIKMNDDFFYSLVGEPNSVDMGLTDYWFYFFTRKLAEENARRAEDGLGPLREAPEPGETEGTLVRFSRYEM